MRITASRVGDLVGHAFWGLFLAVVLTFACADRRESPAGARSPLERTHVRLVADVNPHPGPGGGMSTFVSQGSQVLFVVDVQGNGLTLWTSDGTATGTSLASPLAHAYDFQSFTPLVTRGGVTLYKIRSRGYDLLGRSDGTLDGTYLLTRDGSTIGGSLNAVTTAVDGFRFIAKSGTDWWLWTSDGTSEGTAPRLRLPLPAGASSPAQMVSVQLLSFFACGQALYRTDGTVYGTFSTKAFDAVGDMVPLGGRLIFAASDAQGAELWSSDGTVTGTVRIADIAPGPASSGPAELTVIGDRVFFSADDGATGREIWVTDGTRAGTRRVVDLYPGPPSGVIGSLRAMGNDLYFVANTGERGFEIYATDGAAARIVYDVPRYNLSSVEVLTACEGRLYWGSSQYDGNTTTEGLWASDGTASGTRFLGAPMPGQGACVGSRFVFPLPGSTLWISDGTPGGTVELRSFAATESSYATSLTEYGSEVWFYANAGQGLGVWHSDGSDGGTQPLDALPSSPRVVPSAFAATRGGLVFRWSDVWSEEPWVSDGTAPGTHPIGDVCPGTCYPPDNFMSLDGGLAVFTALDGTQLWATDGTDAGTVQIPSAGVMSPTRYGGRVLFSGYEPSTGMEPWVTDGTAEGTRLLADTAPGAASGVGGAMAVVGELAFFLPPVYDPPLYRTDGTDAGTLQVASLLNGVDRMAAGSDALWFTSYDWFTHATELWRTDGSPAGTSLVTTTPRQISRLMPFESLVLFKVATPDSSSSTLWRSDGTDAGTFELGELELGDGPADLLALEPEHRLIFAANDHRSGYELWITDGSREGTRRFTDVAAGPLHSFPHDIIRHGGELYFVATNGFTGDEVWAASMDVVMDEVKPAVTCPSPITLEATNPGGALVDYEVTATDAMTPSPDLHSAPASGSRFPVGTTTVVATAQDEAGNIGSCEFTVSVRDTTAPVITCPADVAVQSPMGFPQAVSYPAATATDAVGPVTVAHSHQPGSEFPVGTTAVTATATDGAGNSATCTFRVAVSAACGCSSTSGWDIASWLAALVAFLVTASRRGNRKLPAR